MLSFFFCLLIENINFDGSCAFFLVLFRRFWKIFFILFRRFSKQNRRKKCTFLRIFALPQAQHIVKIRKNVHFFLRFCFEKRRKRIKNIFQKRRKRTRKKAQEPSKFMFSINKKKKDSKNS